MIGIPYKDLFVAMERRKLEVTAFGVKISVLGEEDLIELKLKAGRPKDLFDVQEIRSRRKEK